MIEQLLDNSRLEAGRLLLEKRPTDVVELTRNLVSLMQSNSQKHPISLHVPAQLETWIDPSRLEQVLTNLLDNAVKYSPDGGAIEVEIAPSNADMFQIRI